MPCRICPGKGEKLAAKVKTITFTMPSIIWSRASTDNATECLTSAIFANKTRPTACPPGNGKVLHEVDIKQFDWNNFGKETTIPLGIRSDHNEVHTTRIKKLNKKAETSHPALAFSNSFHARAKSTDLKNS